VLFSIKMRSIKIKGNYKSYDRYMFDFNNLKEDGDNGWKINETSNGIYPDGNSKPEILSIKALFRLHNAFIEAPKIWTLFIGALVWCESLTFFCGYGASHLVTSLWC
jgi:hypothetical protein